MKFLITFLLAISFSALSGEYTGAGAQKIKIDRVLGEFTGASGRLPIRNIRTLVFSSQNVETKDIISIELKYEGAPLLLKYLKLVETKEDTFSLNDLKSVVLKSKKVQ